MLTTFILFLSLFSLSPKVYAAQNEDSVFKIVIDLFKSILGSSSFPEATPSAGFGGGSGGGAGATRSGPLPNMTGAVVDQDKALSEQMMSDANLDLNCYTDACGYTSGSVVQSMRNGEAPIICENGCGSCTPGGSSGQTTMNPKILQGLIEVSKTNSICVTALSNAVHSYGSSHYYGNAADIDVSNLSSDQQMQIRSQLNGYCPGGGGAICEVGVDDDPSCTQNNHIHWTCKN